MAGGANTAIYIGLAAFLAAGLIIFILGACVCAGRADDLPNQLLNKRANGESGKAATFNHEAGHYRRREA
jgi:hypothetical protein